MSPPNVYTGVWINHGKGPILGSTLTLTNFHGTLFVAFLALFINFVGNQLWVILSYILFHARSRRTAQDGLYHQLQATLRNSVSSLSDAWKFTLLAWYWRSKSERVMRRVIPLLVLSLLHCIKVGAASIYATPIVQLQPFVLSRGTICGDWNTTAMESDYDVVYRTTEEEVLLWQNSASFARSCLSPISRQHQDIAASCGERDFSMTMWRNDTHEACPFDKQMCKDGHVFALDTGRLDSTLDLGINSPSEDRIQYRRKMTCSPLVTEGFVEGPVTAGFLPGISQPSFWTNTSLWNFNYGKITTNNADNHTNATFIYDDGLLRPTYTFEADSYYKLYVETYYPNGTDTPGKWGRWDRSLNFSTFDAIPELQADGVTSIIFMVTASCYPTPVDDPWFSSHDRVDQGPGESPLYCLDGYGYAKVSPLGCLEQHEFCNSRTGKCSDLTHTHSPPNPRALSFTTRQNAVAQRVFKATSNLGIRGPIKTLGGENTMLARSSALNGPPNNQWQLELENWFGMIVTQMHSQLLQWTTGPSNADNSKYIVPPTDPDVAWMCDNQIVRDTRYICFSVLGISLFISLGSMVVLLGWFIDDLVKTLQTPLGKGVYRRFEWAWNEMFQLQRTAFEAQGAGLWSDGRASVPITKKREKWTIPSEPLDREKSSYSEIT